MAAFLGWQFWVRGAEYELIQDVIQKHQEENTRLLLENQELRSENFRLTFAKREVEEELKKLKEDPFCRPDCLIPYHLFQDKEQGKTE